MLIGDVWLTRGMIADVAELTGTHDKTVARWLRQRALPKSVAALLDLMYNGNVGRIHALWDGWSIDHRAGELVSPEGMTVRPGELRALPYRYHQIAALERRVRDLKARLRSLGDPAFKPVEASLVFLQPALKPGDVGLHADDGASIRGNRRHDAGHDD